MKLKGSVIKIKGARVHNLKNINLDIPRDKLVVITGVSGSGKSSLAFDTIFADGQRRYVESLSAYARQFLEVMEKPDVDSIEGMSPAIAIDQKSLSRNPRSTVGTITEIYDYLRLLYARLGEPNCPKCGRKVEKQTVQQAVKNLIAKKSRRSVIILAPAVRERKGEYKKVIEEIGLAGFLRVRLDGEILTVEEAAAKNLERYKNHSLEVVVDRLDIGNSQDAKLRLSSSVETAFKMGNGLMVIYDVKAKSDELFSEKLACNYCGINLPDIEPRTFSFNNPQGACPVCTGIGYILEVDPKLVIPNPSLTLAEGAIKPWMSASHRLGRQSWYWLTISDLADEMGFSLNSKWADLNKAAQNAILFGSKEDDFEGVVPNLKRRWEQSDSDWTRSEIEKYMVVKICAACSGKRLRPEALAVKIAGYSIDQVSAMSVSSSSRLFNILANKFSGSSAKIAAPIIKEVLNRLQFLMNVGLDYLTLDRSSTTLAGGEAQRIRLATQIGTRLVGVCYILDEPSVGLHARDQNRLLKTLQDLKNLGNSVIVVEHDPQTIALADWVVDMGPFAGKHGGRVVFEGTPAELKKAKTLTGDYFSGRKKITHNRESFEVKPDARQLIVYGAKEHNLKNINVKIPLGKFVCVTGVSGSGKSSLVNDILGRALTRHFWNTGQEPGAYAKIEGLEYLDKAVIIDQRPIGRTPRSNPATYIGVFTPIRELFALTREARVRGYSAGRFSFNVKGGRCEVCQGDGMRKIAMQFLPDMWVECEECLGKRYNADTLEITWHDKSIAEVLEMTVEEAVLFFRNIPKIKRKLDTLNDVGLGYIELGEAATMLSGGEAQRIKLSAELSKVSTGRTFYILDEPTTGLHFADIEKLLKLLRGLSDRGNTVLVIEHNLDVIANADWIIDLGPEGGDKGGHIVAQGAPKQIIKSKKGYTGKYLNKVL